MSLQVKKSRTQGQSLASVGLSKSLFVSIVDTAIALCVEVGITISGCASSVNEGKAPEPFFYIRKRQYVIFAIHIRSVAEGQSESE